MIFHVSDTIQVLSFLITNYQNPPTSKKPLIWTSELDKAGIGRGKACLRGTLSTVESIFVPSGATNERK